MNRNPLIDHSFVADGLLFFTHQARCRYLGKPSGEKARWLRENGDKFIRLDDIEQDSAQSGQPVETENNATTTPAKPASETPFRHVWKDGDDGSRSLVGALREDCPPPYQLTSLPAAANEKAPTGPTQLEPPPRAEAAVSETMETETETILAGGMAGHGPRGRHLPARTSKRQKRRHERMRILLDSLREVPILWQAARKAGVHRRTPEYWIKRSAAGDDGYDLEWQGEIWRFHLHFESAIEEAYDRLLIVALQIATGEFYKIDPLLEAIGCQGVDAFARDANGDFIIGDIRTPNSKMLRFVLEQARPEKWRKHPKIDAPRTGGVLVVGGSTKKPEHNAAASAKVRKWKSLSRMIRKTSA